MTTTFRSPTSPNGARNDSFIHFGDVYLNDSWNIYQFDLNNPNSSFDFSQGVWANDVYALRIEPSLGSGTGETTEFDWIRLVDPNSAPDIIIDWTIDFLPSTAIVSVFVDNDNAGYDGTPLARFTDFSDPGTFTFPSAILPPGNYFFYVSIQDAFGGTLIGSPIVSNYSAQVTINARPNAFVVAPSPISGAEYATDILGDPWDMGQSTDVANFDVGLFPDSTRNFSGQAIVVNPDAEEAGTTFAAITNGNQNNLPGDPPEDIAQVFMNSDPLKAIDPNRFRYLVYRMRADDSNAETILEKEMNGWRSEILFGNPRFPMARGVIENIPVYEGWHTYYIDLWSNPMGMGNAWQSLRRVPLVGLGPIDSTQPTQFEIDWFKLVENNQSTNNQYDIIFTIDDLDNSNFSAQIFYDSDRSGFDGTFITSLSNLGSGFHNHIWDTSGLTEGSVHYIYVVVDDGTNVTRTYSQAPVTIGNPFSFQYEDIPIDYDGDSISDHTVFRPSTGQFFQNRSDSLSVSIQWVNGEQYIPVHGDFDGDNISDLALVFDFFGYYAWYIFRSSDSQLDVLHWGLVGDEIVIADYNGNGQDQIAVFREGVWYTLDEFGGVHVMFWGMPGDIPVPEDYDGDGQDDLAVWRPSDGTWWIINSGFGFSSTEEFTIVQFGLEGDIPVPGRWYSQGEASIGVWRPTEGLWLLQDLDSALSEVTQWGLAGDVPVVGDFNGDGFSEITVFRPPTGNWHHDFRSFQRSIVQYGLPGDKLPLDTFK